MEQWELVNAIEAVLFAAGEPMGLADLRNVVGRALGVDDDESRKALANNVEAAYRQLIAKWAEADEGGFTLQQVAGGIAFRSNPKHASFVRALRAEKPQRLSKAALETLAIVAYRQPVTKPEIDHIRGVDCGGTLRMLLERSMIRMVGKKEEPGRPILYGTTKAFLSFFNLASLNQLPSLREYHELHDDGQQELAAFDAANSTAPSLQDLSRNAKQIGVDEEPAVRALDEAVNHLETAEQTTKDAFATEGVALDSDAEPDANARDARDE